jgi:hypothetical protein
LVSNGSLQVAHNSFVALANHREGTGHLELGGTMLSLGRHRTFGQSSGWGNDRSTGILG